MPFRFRLEPVLRLRERLEGTAALELARAEQRHEAARVRLAELWADEAACWQHLASTAERGTTGGQLDQLARAAEHVHARAVRGAAELAAERQRVDEARAALVDASRARRVLERLEETSRAAHARHTHVIERRQIDDIGTVGHLWRRSQPGFETGGSI
jgi:flagellar export protein FliJ